ncbi:MAG: hypothetical protein HDR71_16360 [Lachnospiraceae bacterium]|nr:hypothetical protein [Lachnospiraceae bacterium]
MKKNFLKYLLQRTAALMLAAIIAATAVASGAFTVTASDEEDAAEWDDEVSSIDSDDEEPTENIPADDPVESGDQEEEAEVTADRVKEQLDNAESAATEAIKSIPFGDVNAKEWENKSAVDNTEDSVRKAEQIIEKAEAEIDRQKEDVTAEDDEEGLLNKKTEDGKLVQGTTEKNTEEANKKIDSAEKTLDTAQNEFDAALRDAQSKIEAGFSNSDDAKAVLENLTQAQQDAQAEFDKAQTDMADAKDNLDKAQEAYEEAKKISDEAAAEAEKALEDAKAEMEKAVEAARTANERVQKVQDILTASSNYLESWKDNVDSALDDIEKRLDESREELNDAIENLDKESEELKEAAEDFQKKFDEFTETAKDFTDSIKDAADAQKELDRLYAKYQELKEAKDTAQEAYDNLGGEAEKSVLKEQLSALEASLEEAKAALEEAEKAKDAYGIIDEAGYVQSLQDQKDILSSEERSDDEKAAAAKELAELVIKNELAGKAENCTVIWVDQDGTGSDGESYGKPAEGLNGYYVVLEEQEDGAKKVVKRYGYSVNTGENGNSGTVDIREMKGQDTTDFIEIDGKQYQINVKDDNSMTITVGDQEISVYQDGNNYFTKEEVVHSDENVRPVRVDMGLRKNQEVVWDNDGEGTITILNIHYSVYMKEDGNWYCYGGIKGFEHEYKLDINEWETKDVITIDGETYDLQEDSDGLYIYTDDNTKLRIFKDEDSYTCENPVKSIPGGDENTIYGYAEDSDLYSSDTYYQKYQEYSAREKEHSDRLSEYKAADEEYQKLKEKYDALAEAQEELEEGELNTLANLPRNVGDVVGNISMDDVKDITELLEKIDSGDFKIKDMINSADTIAAFLPGVDIQEFIVNLTEYPTFDIFNRKKWSEAKHEYAVAWINALKAKIEVVKKGKDLVDATNAAITSGIDFIKAGADVDDALLDSMITGLETGILAGAAGSLVFAHDVLDAANRLAEQLEHKVSELQKETQRAYDEAIKAQDLLLKLKLKNPKEDELKAAEEELNKAWARYHMLEGKLQNAEASLKDAQAYKKAAEDEYKRLETTGETGGAGSATTSEAVDGTMPETDGVVTAGETAAAVVPAAIFMSAGDFATNAAPILAVTAANVPEDVAEVIEDAEEPLSADAGLVEVGNEEVPLANTELVEVEDEEVPLASGENWALLNLLLMMITVIAGGIMVIGAVHSRKEEYGNNSHNNLKLFGIIPAVVSVVVFFLTENIGSRMVFVNKMTLIMLCITVFQAVVMVLSYRKKALINNAE